MVETVLTVSVDFDGTITESSDFGDFGFNKIRYMCKEAMNFLSEMGVKFYLLTGRTEHLQEAIDLCKEWKLNIDLSTPNTKRITDFYIDDKALGGMEIDWFKIHALLTEEVMKRKNIKIVDGVQ